MVKSFFTLSILVLISSAHARKPAVEPILGVSIEEYKEVPPEKAKGFNFERKPTSKAEVTTKRTHSQSDLSKGSAEDSTKTESWVLLLFILLPVIASGITFFRLKKPAIEVTEQPSGLKLVKNSDSDSHDNDDMDFPKAS